MRELSLPLGIYLAVTLVGPALNGAFARPDFAAHAAWTAGTVAAFAGVVVLVRAVAPTGRFRTPRESPPAWSGGGSALTHLPSSDRTPR